MKGTFQSHYRSLFERLGYPLTTRDGIPEAQIAKAESKLGIRLPRSLRDYYLVAGRERRLNHAFNQLCGPSEWEIHERRLIFFEENQSVVVWGVTATSRETNDPAVFQAPLVNGDLDRWYPEGTRCSAFLGFMLHLQAGYGGGMPCTASAPASRDSMNSLQEHWQFGGEVNKMRAYSQEGQVVCVTKWRDFGEEKRRWRAFAGTWTKDGLDAIADDLKLKWD